MPLKAYMTWPGDISRVECCLLVYAQSRNKARAYACHYGFWDDEYIDIHARRKPDFDQYAVGEQIYAVETNDDLPDGVEFYSGPQSDLD